MEKRKVAQLEWRKEKWNKGICEEKKRDTGVGVEKRKELHGEVWRKEKWNKGICEEKKSGTGQNAFILGSRIKNINSPDVPHRQCGFNSGCSILGSICASYIKAECAANLPFK
ncbi:hypothetical protein CDAR_53861 [Caerostris darwini]|uniref:Uncharacterized protein n=1 Tax=Caerostris darwini TaxID=1538125 RepID=A0AAV4WCT1_9ARAC|nr:hypothetical protein CDAR_53861 [Caerostris darwini]